MPEGTEKPEVPENPWWIGLKGGPGYKDLRPFKTEELAQMYAAESGFDREGEAWP